MPRANNLGDRIRMPEGIGMSKVLCSETVNALGDAGHPLPPTSFSEQVMRRPLGTSSSRSFGDAQEAACSSAAVRSLLENWIAGLDVDVDVKIIGWDVMIRIQSSRKNHPAAKLMQALMELDLDLHHASISVVNDLMIQQATVKMGSRFYAQEQLRVALSSKIG